jgi:hypothetical protein
VREHFIWLIPTALVGFAVYVFASNKIMASKQPRVAR